MIDANDFEDEEFYDSEAEPSILEDFANISLNESGISEFSNTYYAVQYQVKIPGENSEDRIFMHQENAIKLLKKDPSNRRFKSFKSFNEAYAFSYEYDLHDDEAPSLSQVKANFKSNKTKDTSKDPPRSLPLEAEKLPFSAPKKSEVNQLRQFIEKNDIESFQKKIFSNPRFLISSGDTANLCQEAFRYNCLHVCAKENRYEICNFLLKMLSNPSFIQKLYKNDSFEQSKMRCNHILDLYLNTPEKGLNETPLHFACKFGSLEVARLLMSYDLCHKNIQNKYGRMPKDMICMKALTEKAKNNLEAITSLFEDFLYVPLYRDEDRGDVTVDKPSPKISITLSNENNNNLNNLTRLNSPLKNLFSESNRKLAAYVGPVSPKNANAIYDRLKSPARLRQSPSNIDILRSDDFKGYERIVRQLTDEMKLPWTEFWAFLNGFSNLKSKEGLDKLEVYLGQKKLHKILELQEKSAIGIISEGAQTNKNFFGTAKPKTNIQLIEALNEFIRTLNELKANLDLKENMLSSKFESFVEAAKKSNSEPMRNQLHIDFVNIEFSENIVKILLKQYMSSILKACKIITESTKCYFDIFKTSKSVFEILNSNELFVELNSSPKTKTNSNLFLSKPSILTDRRRSNVLPQTKPMKRLTPQKKKEIANPFSQMRTTKPSFSESEDEEESDDIKNNLSEEDDDTENIKPVNPIRRKSVTPDTDSDPEQLDNIINKMNQGLKIKDKPISIKVTNQDDECYSLNSLENKKPIFNGFKKPADIKGISKSSQSCYKLFMFGDQPSKLDRAVFLAISNINEDLVNYTLLREWYEFMSNFNKKEMSAWKTPMRKTFI